MVRTSFDAMPAFSRAANTFFIRVVPSALARERLGSCASTPRTTRATSGAAVTRPSPAAWTVRVTVVVGSGEGWARSRTAARAGIMDDILLMRLRPGSVRDRRLRRPTPPAAGGRRQGIAQGLFVVVAGTVRPADEIGGVVRASPSLELGELRKGAQRPRHGHAVRRVVAGELGGEDPLRRLTLLRPAHQRRQGVEHVGARATAAVSPPGARKKP